MRRCGCGEWGREFFFPSEEGYEPTMIEPGNFVYTAGAMTAGLLAVSLGTRMVNDPEAHVAEQATELVFRALQSRDLSAQDADSVLRLQHCVAASTMLTAARMLTRDDELERSVGVDVSRLARSLDRAVREARQILRPSRRHRDAAGDGGLE